MRIAGAKDGRDEVFLTFLVELQGADHRQIAERVVMPIEETELLSAMGGIIGRIHIDCDTPGFTLQPLSVMLDHDIGESFCHAEQFFGSYGVFETGQCRLRSQALAFDGITVEQKLLDRIVGQGAGLIAVGTAGGDSEDALPQKIKATVNNLAGLTHVANTCSDTFGQGELIVDSFEQDGPTVGTAVGLVENNDNRFVIFFGEKNRLCGILSHRRASVCVLNLIRLKYLYADRGFLFYIIHE